MYKYFFQNFPVAGTREKNNWSRNLKWTIAHLSTGWAGCGASVQARGWRARAGAGAGGAYGRAGRVGVAGARGARASGRLGRARPGVLLG